MAAGSDFVDAAAHLLFLAETHLGRNIRPCDGECARLAATALVQGYRPVLCAVHQRIHDGERIVLLHRRMTGVVIHVARARDVFQPYSLLQEILMDIHDLGSRKYTTELVAL